MNKVVISNASVVYAIKDDIIGRLRDLDGNEIMSFILGFTEKDYFDDHYISIEELGDYWISFFDLINQKGKILDIDNGESIIYNDSSDLIMLQDIQTAERIHQILKVVSDKELVDYYISHFCDDSDEILQFRDYFNALKNFFSETVTNDASLLWCIDKM